MKIRNKTAAAACSAMLLSSLGAAGLPGNVQTIRLVEDDAQNDMVSKFYELKYQKANDLAPFLTGAVKRYAKNASVDRIAYTAGKKQFLVVNCPVPLMPYIDDMVAKLDRPVDKKDAYGSGIVGTGITRAVYAPLYRSGDTLVTIMKNAGILASSTDDTVNQDAVAKVDTASNRIYWKDSANKTEDMYKYLAWLDRPIPQFVVSLNVYEVRESDLMDLGIDYLAWKNGPGLNLLDAGVDFIEGSALPSSFGPYGFFAVAPAFDFSFVRVLQQNGKASQVTSSKITVINGTDVSLSFTPQFQNLKKNDSHSSSVASSANSNLVLAVKSPVITVSGKAAPTGVLALDAESMAKLKANLTFDYSLVMKNVVERNNHGNEVVENSTNTSSISVEGGRECMLTRWIRDAEYEQTIGVPVLCDLPILKYIFGTTTTQKEKYFYFLSVKTELMHPDADVAKISGLLTPVSELVAEPGKGL